MTGVKYSVVLHWTLLLTIAEGAVPRGRPTAHLMKLIYFSAHFHSLSRSFRPALNADDPASLRGEKETKIPKKEALHSLQLMEQVRLLRNILSYHQKTERSGGGNPNCPICFGEDGMSDVSSLNTGKKVVLRENTLFYIRYLRK